MKIIIKTPIKGDPIQIISRFDQSLFEALAPPGPGVELVRFDGSKKGDIVHIKLNLFGVKKVDWISKIIEDKQDNAQAYFIDRGITLPFFLSKWEHKHLVKRNAEGSIIIDDIYYQTPYRIFDYLLYPILFFQFAYRRPIYQRIFGKPS